MISKSRVQNVSLIYGLAALAAFALQSRLVHIPRVTTVLQPEGNVEEMVQIGVEVTETIEYNPGSFFVNRTERPK